MMHLKFTVYGTAAGKGSFKAFMRPGMKHPVVVNDSKRTVPWEHAVVSAAFEARRAMGHEPMLGRVAVSVAFYLPPPSSAPKKKAIHPTKKKDDLDKLVRSVLDALTRSGAFLDDGQVVRILAAKSYAGRPEGDPLGASGVPRAVVSVWSEETGGAACGAA